MYRMYTIIYVLFFIILGASSASDQQQSCEVDDVDCHTFNDHLGLEAIRSLHRQLDDDDNGDIDLSESDDVSHYNTE